MDLDGSLSLSHLFFPRFDIFCWDFVSRHTLICHPPFAHLSSQFFIELLGLRLSCIVISVSGESALQQQSEQRDRHGDDR